MLEFWALALLSFFAGLSLLVLIHEFGHYYPAKLFGMRVEKFYLFFDWPRKLFSFRYRGTEYGLGILPLGGYVKITGIIDESMDTEKAHLPPEPHEFRAKPVWQRMIVMVGGVTMNIILGVVIFTVLTFMYGEKRLPMSSLKHGIWVPEKTLGTEIGLKTGDKIIKFKGEEPAYYMDAANPGVLLGTDVQFEVERDGKLLALNVPNDMINTFSEDASRPEAERQYASPMIFMPRYQAIIRVAPKTPAAQTTNAQQQRLQDGDRIIALDNNPIRFYDEIQTFTRNKPNQLIAVTALRNQDTLRWNIQLDANAKIGLAYGEELKTEQYQYGLLGAFVPGAKRAFGSLFLNLKGMTKLFSGDISVRNIDGPVGMPKHFGKAVERGGLVEVWALIGMLSMWLAFINILPIPALDGGHLMLLTVEAIRRRPISTQTALRVQHIGMLFLLSLMAMVVFNDLLKIF
jgi:regulator of sigma E protease